MRQYVLFAVILVLVSAGVNAQQSSQRIQIANDVSIRLDPGWIVGQRTKNSVVFALPSAGPPREWPRISRENPKPQFPARVADARVVVLFERRIDHADALARLISIATAHPEVKTSFTVIAGWPAIVKRSHGPGRALGDDRGAARPVPMIDHVAAAMAAESFVVRFDGVVYEGADPKVIQRVEAMARTLTTAAGDKAAAERDDLRVAAAVQNPPKPLTPRVPRGGTALIRGRGVASVGTSKGELEVAVSKDGKDVLIGAGAGSFISHNGGTLFAGTAKGICTYPSVQCDSDPSVTVGKSGTFYYAYIANPTGVPGHPDSWVDGIATAPDGDNFVAATDAVVCPIPLQAGACFLPDQEHIVADRLHSSATNTNKDLVYIVRDDDNIMRIGCSSTGGQKWGLDTAIDTDGTPNSGILPRVSVGPDGIVYVAYADGVNMMVSKYKDCDHGLTVFPGFPRKVATHTKPPCPVPGLDRCNDGNFLSSPTVAVDDLNFKHVFFAFATSTIDKVNDDILVYDSLNGGMDFLEPPIIANKPVQGRRYMPWMSTYDGNAMVTWFDRRNATGQDNDLTRTFGSRVFMAGGLLNSAEFDISGVDDPQCAVWIFPPRSSDDSEKCSHQPQLAGGCASKMTPTTLLSPLVPCDLSDHCTDPTQVCITLPNGGGPKYGDYVGNATAKGKLYSAWGSSVKPSGQTADTIYLYSSADLIPSNFYVRDSVNDNGFEPSSDPNFWTTSDLWNQSTDTPSSDDPAIGDAPVVGGPNFAFARVRRRSAAASDGTDTDVDVKVNFFVADYGASLPFSAIGSKTVTLHPDDMAVTAAVPWAPDPTASIHLCLGVQIDTPGDSFVPPSLAGVAASGPQIVNDNNTAQRNLIGTIGGTGINETMAPMGNGGNMPENFSISIDEQGAIEGTLEIIGGAKVSLAKSRRVSAGKLRPGEVRWLRIRTRATSDKLAFLHLHDSAKSGNGFSLAIRRGRDSEVATANLRDYAAVLTRFAAITGVGRASQEADAARALLREGEVDPNAYIQFLHEHLNVLSSLMKSELHLDDDLFGIARAARALRSGLRAKRLDEIETAHRAVIERVNAELSRMRHQ